MKFTEEERKLNKEFATEIETKRKLDKELEDKTSEMTKRRVKSVCRLMSAD